MAISPDKEEAVIEILRGIIGRDKKIDRSTLIYDDLRISGDDAIELIERIHREFGTSFKSFRFPDYFPYESESLLYGVFLLFAQSRKKPLTVGHLLDVVDRGEWFE